MTLTSTPVEPPRDPLQEQAAFEFARALGARRRAAGAPVANAFVIANDVPRTPLARLLSSADGGGGGRGGQVRLKLYLSLLWICAKEPYTVTRPARAWAALLGLADIETRGTRRIQEAMRDLAQLGFIELAENAGHPSTVTLLSEHGDGAPYLPASDAYNKLQMGAAEPDELAALRYFRVPSTLWTGGHIASLKGPSLAMLLVLLCEQRGTNNPVWFSPERAKERFTISPSTRTDGLVHLRQLGLVRSTVRAVSESGNFIDFARRRKVHQLVGLKD